MDIQCVPAFILGIITIIAVLCLIFRWFGLKKVRSFYVWIGILAVLGGAWAFLFPLAINADFGKDGDGAALRQMLIYTTGGVLGVITLGENHRKNSLEKAKNDQDHLRQVHAERRSRYTKAIEQLSSDKASIRLGGVYSLVGLVDEWLTIPDIKERRKEGQVIINNLCAYIRSPFPLAEQAEQLDKPYAKDLQKDFDGDAEKFDTDKRAFTRDKAALEEERQIRLSIIQEIRERLRNVNEPGPWSDFDYDFSSTVFFYPTNFSGSLFGASSIFSGATFTGDAHFSGVEFADYANFSGATFTGTNFHWAKFTGDAHFSEAKFTGDANFSGAKFAGNDFLWAEFTGDANFSGAEFADYAHFSGAKFTGDANFSKVKFTGTHFSEAKFTGDANFSGAKFTGTHFSEAKFTGNANFLWAKFTDYVYFSGAKFTGDANFSGAEFTGDANFLWAKFTDYVYFSGAKFTGDANFSEAKFTGNAKFSWAKFTKGADFSGAEFTKADFSGAKFTEASFSEAIFEHIPIFRGTEGSNLSIPAKFSCKANSKDYQFKVSPDSPCMIETEEQEHNGAKFTIPKGAELFDPDEPSDLENNDDI